MNRRLKIAVIGTGRMAQIYADALCERPDVELIGCVGRSAASTQDFCKRYGVKGYANGRVQDLVKELPAADGYVVATPEWVRLAPLRELSATGQPILVEKPLAALPQDAAELRAFPPEVKARITVAHSLRFSPRFSQVASVVHSGAIGEVRHLSSRRNPNLASVKRVLGKFDLAYWLSCHDIDLMRWFLNAEVESVYAVTRCGLTSEDDYLLTHLRFANGVDALHEVSWCSPPLSDQAPMCRFSIKGTKGVVEVDDSRTGVDVYQEGQKLTSPDTYEVYRLDGRQHGLFASLIDRWLRSIREGASAYPSFDDAMHAVDVCTLIMKSIRSGKPESRVQ